MTLFIFTYETGVVGEDANTYHRSSTQFDSLLYFAHEGGLYSKERAQSILNYLYDSTYQTLPEYPIENNNQRRANPNLAKAKPIELNYVKVYPNPAKDLVFFEFLLPCIDKEAKLEITDKLGQKLLDTKIEKEKRQFILDVQKFESGIYNYQLICGGNILSNGQFSVIK